MTSTQDEVQPEIIGAEYDSFVKNQKSKENPQLTFGSWGCG
jgi:hypothetical protein